LTVRIASAALRSREPRARTGRHVSGGTLETCDPSDGLRGHAPLQGVEPPGGRREVIHSFDGGEPLPLANWQGREHEGPVLLDAGFREPGRGGLGRSVKLVFRKHLAGWANFNLPIPVEAARSSGGVSLWLKGARDDDDVELSIHVPAGSGPGSRDRFFTASVLLRRGWREVALPWPAFSDAGRPLSLEGVRSLNLQVVKPGDRLERDLELEVDDAGLWR
jgi:hypothetical protein